MTFKAKLKIILKADTTVVAESSDPVLWQKVLSSINSGGATPGNSSKEMPAIEAVSYDSDDKTANFAKYVGVTVDQIKAAIAPEPETPFVRLDHHYWEAMKKHLPERGPTAIPDVVIAATILALWKNHAKLGDTMLKEATQVLSDLGLVAKNPTRSITNCEWLQLRSNKVIINAVEISRAIKLVKSFCLKKDPNSVE